MSTTIPSLAKDEVWEIHKINTSLENYCQVTTKSEGDRGGKPDRRYLRLDTGFWILSRIQHREASNIGSQSTPGSIVAFVIRLYLRTNNKRCQNNNVQLSYIRQLTVASIPVFVFHRLGSGLGKFVIRNGKPSRCLLARTEVGPPYLIAEAF